MSFKIIIFSLLANINQISADWVKLPVISPTTEVPKVVFKLAPPPKSSVLSSEMINNVFSQKPTMPTTTASTIFSENTSTRKSYIRQYFQTTVTSKVVNILDSMPSLTNNDDFLEPVFLQAPEKNNSKFDNKNRVVYFNKTMPISVIPVKSTQIVSKLDGNATYQNNDDDGIEIGDDEDIYDDDEYYYEYEDETSTKFHYPYKVTSTTTDMPPKTHKKKTFDQKLQRRTMMQMMKSKQYKPFGDISFPSFIKFLRKIQESFAIRTAKTIGEKIRMLVHFRDQLMLTINKQIRRLWKGQPQQKGKKSTSNKRTKRTLGLDHGNSGAMDFPSAEGALLSICFLTFAVFLIKLVLQVIHTIKMKKAMWATQMMMGTENVVIKRQQRSTPSDEDLSKLTKIYESIEKLRLKYE